MEKLLNLINNLKLLFNKYYDLIFRIGLVLTILIVWQEFGQTITYCTFYGSGDLSDSQIACKTLRDEERILRSFFTDSYPVVIFLGLFYVLSWFKKK